MGDMEDLYFKLSFENGISAFKRSSEKPYHLPNLAEGNVVPVGSLVEIIASEAG
jgi:hypothetical protein